MEEKETDIKMLPIVELHDFEGHPFKVEHDMALFELMRSIENEGVIVPALASPKADELLAKQVGENRMTIHRYIRLTNLIPKVLDMVDEGKIAFTVAVELSYLTEEQQYELYEFMSIEQCTPSLSQTNRMKRLSQSGVLDMELTIQIYGANLFVDTKWMQMVKMLVYTSG